MIALVLCGPGPAPGFSHSQPRLAVNPSRLVMAFGLPLPPFEAKGTFESLSDNERVGIAYS